jgi:hypothetical protein
MLGNPFIRKSLEVEITLLSFKSTRSILSLISDLMIKVKTCISGV